MKKIIGKPHRRRLGADFGGNGKFVSRTKFSIFFLVIDRLFCFFCLSLLSEILYIYNDPFLNEKPLLHNTEFLRLIFFSHFPHIPYHYFSKYLGDGSMGRPPQILGGPSPSPPEVSAHGKPSEIPPHFFFLRLCLKPRRL